MAIIMQSFRSDPTKVFSAEAREWGIQLASLVEANINDPAKLEKAVKTAGYAQDSCGQFFKDGKHVPTPAILQPNFLKNAPTLV